MHPLGSTNLLCTQELTNLIHDQCLHSHGYSIDECNLYLKNDEKLKAPSWSAAIEAENSPIVDIFVRFKDARELERDEYERAETERERQRYRAEDKVEGRDLSVPTTRRAIRGRSTLDSYHDRKPPARRTGNPVIRYERDEKDVMREPRSSMLIRKGTRDREKCGTRSFTRSRRDHPSYDLVTVRHPLRLLSYAEDHSRSPEKSIKRRRRTDTGDKLIASGFEGRR